MNITSENPKIIVVGSSSVDLVLNTDFFPQANETVMAVKSESFFGGKGANQAVAASRLGASVYFVGCVGMDPMGQQVMRNLLDEGVNVGFVHESENAPTGTAYVTASEGKNAIVVVPAANSRLSAKHVYYAEKFFPTADMILVQLEIPMEAVLATYEMAKKYGKKLGIYAAPAVRLPQEIVEYANFIVVKSNDISTVFGDENKGEILRKNANKIFVRDETNSTIYYNGSEMKYFRNEPGQQAHKMGMGDAFTAGFALAACHGNSIDDCVVFGNEVSLKVGGDRGSQKGLPYLKDFIK